MVLLLGAAVLLVVVATVFMHLRVEVDDATLRFRFGPFGRTLSATDIESATVERYRWGTFGGWGWRFGWLEGVLVQAFSVPSCGRVSVFRREAAGSTTSQAALRNE